VNDTRETKGGLGGLSYRSLGAIAVAILVLLFIALNRDDAEVSFVVFDAQTSLWLALAVAAAGGFVAGLLVGRQRYRR
jgi:uncharacterized integral membrane protein